MVSLSPTKRRNLDPERTQGEFASRGGAMHRKPVNIKDCKQRPRIQDKGMGPGLPTSPWEEPQRPIS